MEAILGFVILVFIISVIIVIVKSIKTLVKGIRALFKTEKDTLKNQSSSNSTYNYKSKYQNVQSNPYDPSSALDEALLWELQQNGKIRAIKLLRENTGYSLADAKTYVENLELCLPAYNAYKRDSEVSKVEDVSSVDGMDGHAFEHYCAQLLRKNCFTDVSITPASGDQGVDVLATKDGIKYAIQCKNYATPLSNTPIQEVNAGKVFYNCHVGVVMTNSTFTPKAKELALATGVLLWDRQKLQELITASNPTLTTAALKQETATNHSATPTSQPPSRNIVRDPITSPPVTSTPPLRTSTQDTARTIAESFFANREAAIMTEDIDGVRLNIHSGSASAVDLTLSGFGIDKDDETPDQLTLLFDVEAKNVRGIPEDVTIVCNAYAGNQKLATEYEYLFKERFCWKDSLEVYFNKKNLARKTTRIEIFCKRG